MTAKPEPRMSSDAFLAWIVTQERRHELVDGRPVMMTGGSQAHEQITSNVFMSFALQLKGRGCRPTVHGPAVRTPRDNVLYPDVVVDCGRFEPKSQATTEPVCVVEVLSPSTRAFDLQEKLIAYRSVPTIRVILYIDQEFLQVRFHRRSADGTWITERLDGPDAVLALPEIDATLTLAEIYEGLDVGPPPPPVRVVD